MNVTEEKSDVPLVRVRVRGHASIVKQLATCVSSAHAKAWDAPRTEKGEGHQDPISFHRCRLTMR